MTELNVWQHFQITPGDLEYLANLMMEEEVPRTLDDLARALIEQRHAQLSELARAAQAERRIYRPAEAYQVGEKVLFPHLGQQVGVVVAVRPGNNPEYPPFEVIQVRFDAGELREFAAKLPLEHPLNQVTHDENLNTSPEEVYATYGELIKAQLQQTLSANRQFVAVADQWFLRELLLEIEPAQLNIVEAILDMAGGEALPTEAFLEELELPREVTRALQIFSLEYALERDERFDEVGPTGKALWVLRRMEPASVQEVPPALRYIPIPYNRALLPPDAAALEKQLDDEWSDVPFDGEPEQPVQLVLTAPHWLSGTLPLTPRLARLFPTARLTDHILFTFRDEHSGETFKGWVVRSGRYVSGLKDFYARYQFGIGAYLEVARGPEEGVITIKGHPIRGRRGDWLRVAHIENGRILFRETRAPVTCETDPLMNIYVSDAEALRQAMETYRRISLDALVDDFFTQLAALSPQRMTHAATLYSAVNLVYRITPGPLLALLAAKPQRYAMLGDHYWALKE